MARQSTTILMVVALVACRSAAQEPAGHFPMNPVSSLPNVATLSFERVLNTYFWNGGVSYTAATGPWSLSTDQRFRSRLIKSDLRSVQDEYVGGMDVTYDLDSPWKVRGVWHSSVLSDNRAIDLAKMSQHQVLAGAAFRPQPTAGIELLGGYELNSQQSYNEHGPTWLLGGSASDLEYEQLKFGIRGSWAQTALQRRTPYDGGGSLTIMRDFGTSGLDSLTVRFNVQQREFFVNAGSVLQSFYGIDRNVFTRRNRETEVGNYLVYFPADRIRLFASGSFLVRSIDRGTKYKDYTDAGGIVLDTRIDELMLNARVSLEWSPVDWIQGTMDLLHSERDERHATVADAAVPVGSATRQEAGARRLANLSKWTSLSTQWNIAPRPGDSLRLLSSAGILRYDTPDSTNVDDRDELMMSVGVSYISRWNERFLVRTSLDANLIHQVYLSGQQSANNTWNRVLRFEVTTEFRPSPRFVTVNSSEVLANYTVFDFEEQFEQVHSYSFRQARWSDSTVWLVGRQFQLDFAGSLRLFQRGLLKWKEFKERPEFEFLEVAWWPRAGIRGSEWFAGLGFRSFFQKRYKVTSSSSHDLDMTSTSYGPTVSAHWNSRSGFLLAVEGWREFQVVDRVATNSVSNLSIRIQWLL